MQTNTRRAPLTRHCVRGLVYLCVFVRIFCAYCATGLLALSGVCFLQSRASPVQVVETLGNIRPGFGAHKRNWVFARVSVITNGNKALGGFGIIPCIRFLPSTRPLLWSLKQHTAVVYLAGAEIYAQFRAPSLCTCICAYCAV